jgi:hypothetical protein
MTRSSGPVARYARGFTEGASQPITINTPAVMGAVLTGGQAATRMQDAETTLAASAQAVPATIGFRMGLRREAAYDLSTIHTTACVVLFSTSSLADRNAIADWMQETYGV